MLLKSQGSGVNPLSGKPYLTAVLEVDGAVLRFSQYESEYPHWLMDALFAPSGMPLTVQGDGSRFSLKRRASDEAEELLNAAAPKWGEAVAS